MSFGDFCTHCGVKHDVVDDWPRTCSNGHIMYLPVQPKLGEVALPGGYVDPRSKKKPKGETWKAACARELFEESSETILVAADEVEEFMVLSATDSNLCLVFGITNRTRTRKWFETEVLPRFKPSEETQELLLIERGQPICFPLHTEAANRFFDNAKFVAMQMQALRA
jgi:hypothetical protein